MRFKCMYTYFEKFSLHYVYLGELEVRDETDIQQAVQMCVKVEHRGPLPVGVMALAENHEAYDKVTDAKSLDYYTSC